jgi:hypothetical protein
MSTARRSDWWILGIAIATIAALVIAGWLGCLSSAFVQNAVLSGTAVIILWYTIETTRLRREAEARARRDREPRVYFEVQQPENKLPALAQTMRPGVFAGEGVKHILRFNFINQSPNSALACIRARLRVGPQVGAFPQNSEYGGGVPWQITPFFRVSGVFDLIRLIENAQKTLPSEVWPHEHMVLSVQVDLYWPNRQLFESVAKEYHVHLDVQKCGVEFWPEVNTRSLGLLPCPKQLPEGPSLRVEDPSVSG